MIEILTLLTGLLTGPQPVALRAAAPVARIEVFLDGSRVALLAGPPWQTVLDLGDEPAPHVFEVVARGTAGEELARLRQGLGGAPDTPRPFTPLRIVGEAEPPPVEAMTGWFTAAGQPLAARKITDGSLRLKVVASPAAHARLGELAQALIQQEVVSRSPPGHDEFRQPWNPTVLDDRQTFLERAGPLLDTGGSRRRKPLELDEVWDAFQKALPWPAGAEIERLSPLAAPVSRLSRVSRVFAVSRRPDDESGGLLWHAVQARPEHDLDLRLADAVAVAGLELAGSSNPTPAAILVLMTSADHDQSRFDPVAVRRYLARIDVPLLVGGWYDEGAEDDGWGPPTSFGVLDPASPEDTRDPQAELRALRDPFESWSHQLRAQQVVWLEGVHDPDRIMLTAEARGIRRATEAMP